jgi:hypothetical protein
MTWIRTQGVGTFQKSVWLFKYSNVLLYSEYFQAFYNIIANKWISQNIILSEERSRNLFIWQKFQSQNGVTEDM